MCLGGGFEYCSYSPLFAGSWSNVTNNFQTAWNHQLGVVLHVQSFLNSFHATGRSFRCGSLGFVVLDCFVLFFSWRNVAKHMRGFKSEKKCQYICSILLDTVLDLIFTVSECICIGASYVISPCCQSKHKLISLLVLSEGKTDVIKSCQHRGTQPWVSQGHSRSINQWSDWCIFTTKSRSGVEIGVLFLLLLLRKAIY